MKKSLRIKQKRLARHRKRRKFKGKNANPYESAREEYKKQLLKGAKIKAGKLEKKEKDDKT